MVPLGCVVLPFKVRDLILSMFAWPPMAAMYLAKISSAEGSAGVGLGVACGPGAAGAPGVAAGAADAGRGDGSGNGNAGKFTGLFCPR